MWKVCLKLSGDSSTKSTRSAIMSLKSVRSIVKCLLIIILYFSVMEDANEVDIDDLNSLKTQLNMLEEKVKVDMKNDKYVTEDVEKIIQQFLTVFII